MQLGLRSADDETGGKSGGFGRMKMEEPRELLDRDRLFRLGRHNREELFTPNVDLATRLRNYHNTEHRSSHFSLLGIFLSDEGGVT